MPCYLVGHFVCTDSCCQNHILLIVSGSWSKWAIKSLLLYFEMLSLFHVPFDSKDQLMSTIAYYRVSTRDQHIDNQRQQMDGHKIDREFVDQGISGTTLAADRPALSAMLDYVREGDTVVVVAVDRLGRNTVDVLTTVEALITKGVKVVSLREGVDFSTPVGKMVLTVISGLSTLELEILAERRTAGIARAKADGVHCGRPRVEATAEQVKEMRKTMTVNHVAEQLGVSVATVYRLQRGSN